MRNESDYYRVISRRTLFGLGGSEIIKASAGAATIIGVGLLAKSKIESISQDTPIGKFIDLSETGFEYTDKPQQVEVTFTPVETSDPNSRGKIIFRRSPQITLDDPISIQMNEIGTRYAARVFGGTFLGPQGNLTASYNLEPRKIGLWFAITDKFGAFIDPYGQPLKEKEPAYYTSANFVTVLKQSPSPTPRSL